MPRKERVARDDPEGAAMTAEILAPDQLAGAGLALIGGKARGLQVLRECSLRVPPFRVITTEAWLRAAPPRLPIGKDDATMAGVRFRPQPALGLLAREVAAAVADGVSDLAFPVAVRSSGLSEDGGASSYAGRFPTMLNVRRNALADAVLRIWASAAAVSDQPMAVIVQQMAKCDFFGVAFTVNPVTGADELLIEFARSAGPSVVGGRGFPTRLRVSKSLDVISGAAELPGISSTVMPELFEGASRVARYCGRAQDIEFGFDSDCVTFLQARPVTAVGVQ